MAHMKLKKVSKRTKFKLVFILIIIYLTFSYTFYNSLKNNQSYYSQEFLTYLLEEGNPHLVIEYKLPHQQNHHISLKNRSNSSRNPSKYQYHLI